VVIIIKGMPNMNKIIAYVIFTLIFIAGGYFLYQREEGKVSLGDKVFIEKLTDSLVEKHEENIAEVDEIANVDNRLQAEKSASYPQMNLLSVDELKRENVRIAGDDLGVKIQEALGINGEKKSILLSLVTDKLNADLEVNNLMTATFSDPSILNDLLSADNTDLSLAELKQRELVEELAGDIQEKRAANRAKFEEKISNLLTSNEMDAFKRMESNTVKEARNTFMLSMKDSVSELPSINDYQLGQIDKIIQTYNESPIEDVRIGSTVSPDGNYSLLNDPSSIEFFSGFQQGVISQLSQQQQQELTSAIMHRITGQ
jgi:hypothetical protein